MKDCLQCHRKVGSRARGLCGTCYQRSNLDVKYGVCTWQQLESVGRCLPSNNRPEKPDEEWGISEEDLARIRTEIMAEVMTEMFGMEKAAEVLTVSELLELLAERMRER
jgi:hypothetical protein